MRNCRIFGIAAVLMSLMNLEHFPAIIINELLIVLIFVFEITTINVAITGIIDYSHANPPCSCDFLVPDRELARITLTNEKHYGIIYILYARY